MESNRFDQIEAFVRSFTGPATRASEAYREECLFEAKELLAEVSDLSPDDASDYYPQTSLLLWLAEIIEVISTDGRDGATEIHPALVPKPFGPTTTTHKELEDVVFDRLSASYPILTGEFEKCRSAFKSSNITQ